MHQHDWQRVGLVTAACWCGAAKMVGERIPPPPTISPAEQAYITAKWRAWYDQLLEDVVE